MANVTFIRGDFEEGQRIAGLVSAGLGVVPILIASAYFESVIALASAMITLSGLFHSNLKTPVETTRALVEVVDSVVAVLFTLLICVRIGTHRSIVGVLRMFWIIAIVTSSCTYNSIRGLAPDDFSFIPNDITIIALGVACFLLVATYIASRLSRVQSARDTRVIIVESALVLGSFALRFEDDIARVTRLLIGWMAWYLACHLASLIALYIVRHPRSEEIIIDARLSTS
jgi:hypothetical protein